MLVQCLKDSVVNMATAPPPTPQELEEAPEAVVLFSAKIEELDKCLTQMAQHMGTLYLQQKRAHLVGVAVMSSVGVAMMSLGAVTLMFGVKRTHFEVPALLY